MKDVIEKNIADFTITLSERVTWDVRELEDYAKRHRKQLTNRTQIGLLCIKIIDAIKPAYKKIKFYRLKKKYNYRKRMSVRWLMKHLSDTEIYELDEAIDELEDYEKKKLRQLRHAHQPHPEMDFLRVNQN